MLIEKYAKENFTQDICVQCGRQGSSGEFYFVTRQAVTCWAPDSCSEEEGETRCPDCHANEDSIKDQGDLFIELIGDEFKEDMEYEYYEMGLNDIEEAYNPHIMVVEEATGYVEERVYLCAE